MEIERGVAGDGRPSDYFTKVAVEGRIWRLLLFCP